MAAQQHGGGFSVDARVCIAGDDRAALERLLRYCARPPFAMERLHQRGPGQMIYHCPKPQSGGKRGDLVLTPLELIAKIAALIPPPRIHRHRYYGVLAPNSPLRTAVTGLATQGEDAQDSGAARARKVPAGVGEPAAPESASRSPGTILVGAADRPHLRSIPLVLPAVFRTDAHHRVHHRQGGNTQDSGAYRGRSNAAEDHAGTRAAIVGWL